MPTVLTSWKDVAPYFGKVSMKNLLLVTSILSLMAFVGCSGSASVALQSITVTPSTATVAPNGTQQYSAIGHYSDGSTQDLTSSVSWSANAGATITAGGLATGITPGATVQIAAAALHLQIVGFATLTITNS